MTQTARPATWIERLDDDQVSVDELVRIAGYRSDGRPPEEVVMMEKAAAYGAHAVFFEARAKDQPGVAQAFVFLSDGPADDLEFAALHKRLWSWGGVPLAYRRTPGLVQLFRCAHKPDFVSPDGGLVCRPVKTLRIAAAIGAGEAWWDAERLRNGTLWDDPAACKLLLSAAKSAHRRLVDAVAHLHEALRSSGLLESAPAATPPHPVAAHRLPRRARGHARRLLQSVSSGRFQVLSCARRRPRPRPLARST